MDRNIVEIEIDVKVEGQEPKKRKIGFKCGTLAIAIACREANIKSLQGLLIMIGNSELLAMLAFFYGCYCQYNNVKAPEFTMDNMSDLLEEIGVDKSGEAIKTLLKVYLPKNQAAPQAGAIK
jgi:hypothetical protein